VTLDDALARSLGSSSALGDAIGQVLVDDHLAAVFVDHFFGFPR
jgi:hypothetical protein